MKEQYYDICSDCAFYITYDELPNDLTRAQEVYDGYDRKLRLMLDMDYKVDLSRCPCDCCGTRLLGIRNRAIGLVTV